jgi:hypothetical protein
MNLKTLLTRKSPEIFLGLSIVGYIGSMIVVGATSARLERKRKIIASLPKKEKIALYAKAYGPSIAMGTLTISMMVGGYKTSLDRTSAAIAMYQFVKGSLDDHKAQVLTTIGDKKSKMVEGDNSEKRMRRYPIPEQIDGVGSVLCFDDMSGRFFYSDMETLRKAQNDFNESLLNGENMRTLNDFYYDLNIKPIKLGENIGWEVGKQLVSLEFDSKLTSTGKPCLIVRQKNLPELLW